MKVCLLRGNYLDKRWTGINTYTHNLAEGLSLAGVEVHIICKKNLANFQDKKINNIWIHTIETNEDSSYQFFLKPYMRKKVKKNKMIKKLIDLFYPIYHCYPIDNLRYSYQVYQRFREIDRRFSIDVVEAPDTGAEGFFLSIFTRKKLITRLHTPLYLYLKNNGVKPKFEHNFQNFIERAQAANSVLITSPTSFLSRIIVKDWDINESRFISIPNPIAVDKKKLDEKARKQSYILFLGRLENIKGIDVFLKSLRIVFKQYPAIKVYIVGGKGFGSGTYHQKKLERRYRHYGKNLKFLGEVGHDRLLKLIRSAKIIILPSRWENQPYALLESLSCEKMVIVSDQGGFKEIIKDGYNGWLFEPGSEKSLAKTINRGMSLNLEQKRFIETNARKTALQYDYSKVIPQFIKLYSAIRSNKGYYATKI